VDPKRPYPYTRSGHYAMKRTLGKLNLTQAIVIVVATQGYDDSYPVIP